MSPETQALLSLTDTHTHTSTMKTRTKHILLITDSVWHRLCEAREACGTDRPLLHVELNQSKLNHYSDGSPFRAYGVRPSVDSIEVS